MVHTTIKLCGISALSAKSRIPHGIKVGL